MLLTPIYASVLALIFIGLSFNVIRFRLKTRIPFGDGKDLKMKRAIRVHGNFSEYVPITLLMMYFVEIQSQNPLLIHGLGISFILARVFHIHGVSQLKENVIFRVLGLFMTGCVIGTCAIILMFS